MSMYETNDVKERVPEVIRNALWIALANMKQPDFKQRFDLHSTQKNGQTYQRIIHTQNDSAYQKKYEFELQNPIEDMTVFIIGFGTDGWLMMLPP
jgi:hypothetical protein